MKKQVFEYVVLYHEKNDEGKIVDTKLILSGKDLYASEKNATFAITRKIPDKYVEFFEDIEIVIRPF